MIDPFFDPTDDIQSDEFEDYDIVAGVDYEDTFSDAITMDDMVNTEDEDENSIDNDYDEDNDYNPYSSWFDDTDEDE